MRNRIMLSSLVLSAMGVALMLGGCGSAKKEGAGQPLATAARVDNNTCTNDCHAGTVSLVASAAKDANGNNIPIPADWRLSTHATAKAADCQDCHGGGSLHWGLGPIPFPNPDTALVCTTVCHANMPAPHFNNITSAGYPASFVTSQNVGKCRNCHNPHNPTTQMPVNTAWAGSGHGDTQGSPWKTYDFKTRGTAGLNPATSGNKLDDCVRCHTTTGYINFVTSNFADAHAWGVASDKTKEVLQCNACHDKTYNFDSRRTVGKVTGFYNYSAAAPVNKRLVNFPFPDVKTSNICMSCHVGKESGRTLQAIAPFANFSSLSFVNSHYLTAGATIFKASGYEYAGQNYANPGGYIHDQIGLTAFLTGVEGPCVGCHMDTAGAAGFDRHTFLPVTKVNDPARINDTINTIVTPLCANCHPGTFTANAAGGANLQTFKSGYNAALAALAEALKLRGYTFAGGYPYFSNKNWQTNHGATGGFGAGTGANTMGAAFNFNLLRHDYGGFAHNDVYVKRLIFDSIDWITDGVITPGVNIAAVINALPDDPVLKYGLDGSTVNFNAAMRAAAIAWLGGGLRP